MLRFILLACLMAFVGTAPISAHQGEDAPATGVEIGTLFGLTHLDAGNGTDATTISVPGGGPPLSSLYVLSFPSETLAIGSEFGFTRVSRYSSQHLFSFGGRIAFFLKSNAMSDAYILGQTLMLKGDSDSNLSIGAGLGYQWRVGPAFVLRAEGRYRRWFEDDVNDISLTLGLGTRLSSR